MEVSCSEGEEEPDDIKDEQEEPDKSVDKQEEPDDAAQAIASGAAPPDTATSAPCPYSTGAYGIRSGGSVRRRLRAGR